MATLEQFKEVRASVSLEVQNELYALAIQDPDAAVQRMIGIASENGASFTADEVNTYLLEMDAEDEFDDIELDEATLAAVSGRGGRGRVCGRGREATPTPKAKTSDTATTMQPAVQWHFTGKFDTDGSAIFEGWEPGMGFGKNLF